MALGVAYCVSVVPSHLDHLCSDILRDFGMAWRFCNANDERQRNDCRSSRLHIKFERIRLILLVFHGVSGDDWIWFEVILIIIKATYLIFQFSSQIRY